MDTPAEPRGSAASRQHNRRRESDAPQTGVDGPASPAVQDDARETVLPLLPEICALVKRKTGHDFSRYKQSTLARRFARRISILSLADVPAYIDRLHQDVKEVEDLFQDLLIGVTQFFRDPEAFEALATKIIPQLYKRPPSAGPIRIWISGCATGEEAYSIAMLLADEAANIRASSKAMVFATDLDG